MSKGILRGLVLTFGLFAALEALACTDFRIKSKDGAVLVTRSMEFAQDFNSNIRTQARGTEIVGKTPDGKPALSWKSKYGFIYADGMNQPITIDGMNEKGLSFEYLYLPNETQYQSIPATRNQQAVSYINFPAWVLGNFESVDEVKRALQTITVFQDTLPSMGKTVFPLHASIFDATGKGIVVEFVNGKMNVFDNEIGIMTNSPTYDWHLVNLRNYINLSPFNPNPVTFAGLVFPATGQGAGMEGLPGNIAPPSRFVKMAVFSRVTEPAATIDEALNLAQHFINNVDIFTGLARAKVQGKDVSELTQWVVFKDLTNKMFYYRTYNDMTLRSIALDKLDFSEQAQPLKMPMKDKPYVMDRTQDFLSTGTKT